MDAEDDNNMDATPLRLIDVEATLSNENAGGIIFTRRRSWHVISHTWSADVRKLSKIIGKRLASVASTWWACWDGADADHLHGHRSYDQLFATSDFSKESSYKKLLDFLMILRSDQVKWVWFDAVCINQQDREEKEREIGRMGLYYEKSTACHVVHHGIGRGFEMQLSRGGGSCGGGVDAKQVKEVNTEDVIPRWFSRAWTFQEWILPPKTTFIIDLASEQSLARTAYGILLNEHEQHETCSCCYFETSLSPIYVRKLMVDSQQPRDSTATSRAPYFNEGSERAEDNRDDQLASLPIYRIRRCCRPSIREPHFRKVPNRRNWYFADDLGFAFLIRVKLQMVKLAADDDSASKAGGAPRIIAVQQQKDFALNDAEFELTGRLALKGYFRGESDYSITREKRIRLTIQEMQVRDCSNAEDRVLSVLKLLGVEGLVPVRSSKSLKEQVIRLARASLDLQQDDSAMLLQLCLVDGFGNETREMSWAPHFEVKKDSWQAGARPLEISGSPVDVAAHHFDTFQAEAQVRELSSKGGLQIAASVCAGHLVCCEHQYTSAQVHPGRMGASSDPFRKMALEVDGQALVFWCARVSPNWAGGDQSNPNPSNPAAISARDHHERSIVLEIVGSVETISKSNGSIAFPAVKSIDPHDCLHLIRERVPLWLVKLGVGMHGSSGLTYFLVCIGGQTLKKPLHKIGYIGISSTAPAASALLTNKPTLICCIAGIRRSYLHDHFFRTRGMQPSSCINLFVDCCH